MPSILINHLYKLFQMCIPHEQHHFRARINNNPPITPFQEGRNNINIKLFVIDVMIGFVIFLVFHIWITFLLYKLYS